MGVDEPVMFYLVRDPTGGGCAVCFPTAHLGMRLVSDREPRASEASGLLRRHKRLNHDGAPSAVFKDQCAALAYRDTKGIIFFSAGCVKDHIPKA
jgi:hypothetical protein